MRTVWEYQIVGFYDGREESVFTANNKQEALIILHDYRKNERGTSFRIRRVLVKESEGK